MTDPLVTPFRLGPLGLRNRIVFLPMYLAYPDPDHEVNDLVLDYYTESAESGAAYLSVVAGCYDSPPQYVVDDRQEACMAPFAAAVKEELPETPVIAAGRLQRPETARAVLTDGAADLVGLGRVAFADPLWPGKARGDIAEPIIACAPACNLCMKRIIEQKPAYCARWPKERRERLLERVGG